ncbi:MAG: Hsp20/alpha crystallin family protein [Bacillota bacterium]|nr:Hsp20/alpha crystallin family protein [Bacillota bacterium]
MYTGEEEKFVKNEEMEKWLKNFFLDPLTSHFDQTQFQIDIYETEMDWILEAILSGYQTSDITVFVEGKKLIITVVSSVLLANKKRIRIIEFPFPIMKQLVTASFYNGILEIFISKTEKGLNKNRFITLP